jgi:hypothetical protein
MADGINDRSRVFCSGAVDGRDDFRVGCFVAMAGDVVLGNRSDMGPGVVGLGTVSGLGASMVLREQRSGQLITRERERPNQLNCHRMG